MSRICYFEKVPNSLKMHKSNLTFFSQIIHLIDRNLIDRVIGKHQSDKHTKGFSTWNQLICMIFGHLSNAHSIRDIVYGICSTTGNLAHINIRSLPKRSTLSYANQHRSHEVFRDIYFGLLEKFRHKIRGPRIKFALQSKIYLLDSTFVALSLKVFDWAVYKTKKGAMKIHTLLDYYGGMPEFLDLTHGKESDNNYAQKIHIPAGSVVIGDRGYFDFDLLRRWDKELKIRFVVRAKEGAIYKVLADNPVDKDTNLISDQLVLPDGPSGRAKYKEILRMVKIWDEENQRIITLITNETSSWTAETISELYRARWEIELFFKTIKQHLKIKSFVGTSVNAVLIQIWTAMITLLLIKYLQAIAKFNWHLSNLVAFMRINLLVAGNLYGWLNDPIFFTLRGSPNDLAQGVLFEDGG